MNNFKYLCISFIIVFCMDISIFLMNKHTDYLFMFILTKVTILPYLLCPMCYLPN